MSIASGVRDQRSMNIKIESVEGSETIHRDGERQLTRFGIFFTCALCSGKASLFVFHSPTTIDLEVIRKSLVGQTVVVTVTVEQISNLQLSESRCARMAPVESNDAFIVVGQIVEHLFTGEGSVFAAGELVTTLFSSLLPPDSLEVALGSWVSLKVQGLGFWPSFQSAFSR